MAKPSIRKRVGKRYTAPEFRPYVTALGQLSLAWNDLQECFGALFWTLMSPPPLTAFAHREALFVWYSIKSDRSQREMLKAAANNLTIDWRQPALVDEINWTINKADRLEDWRNDAVHSPLFLNRAEGPGRRHTRRHSAGLLAIQSTRDKVRETARLAKRVQILP
jgi:hypothetical protein